jgi:hypothetical protein
MAKIKGWKKISDDKDNMGAIIQYVERKDNRHTLLIYAQTYINRPGKDWFVDIYYGNKEVEEIKFNTKKEAMDFAYDYMNEYITKKHF